MRPIDVIRIEAAQEAQLERNAVRLAYLAVHIAYARAPGVATWSDVAEVFRELLSRTEVQS